MTDETSAKETWRIGQRRRLGPPKPGFAGPGHTAVEVIGTDTLNDTDPFVLLMDDRLDFPAGQRVGGPHPHAGLETVTFVLEGSLLDRDIGELFAGDVEWMTAGSGVVHNEDVRATGRARILQLWVTLPERERAATPRFDVLRRAEMPVHRAPGVEARLYSGRIDGLASATLNHVPVTLVDVRLDPGAVFETELPTTYNGFVFPVTGSVHVGDADEPLEVGEIGWLARRADGGSAPLRIRAGAQGAHVLLYAGEPQDEPTVQYGPFVAGSPAAIERMYRDYRAGRFTRLSTLGQAAPASL